MMNERLALLDANIFVYSNNKDSPFCQRANQILEDVIMGKLMACITPQVLWEFFAVVTDTKRFDKPVSLETVIHDVQFYWNMNKFVKIFPGHNTIQQVLNLVKKYHVIGQHVHDVRLVATMLDNNIKVLYSADTTLQKFEEITVINPFK